MSIAIVFMIKPYHHLEWQAVLLASCWRTRFGEAVNLYAYIEHQEIPDLAGRTLQALAALNVQVRALQGSTSFNGKYPIGNKILVCSQTFAEDRVIFCDSDLLILKDFDLDKLLQGEICVAAAGARTWGKRPKSWPPLYEKYSIPDQPADIPLQDGTTSPPYYNAGLISFKRGTGFGDEWLTIARRIDFDPSVEDKRPWLDQIALPIAAGNVTNDLHVLDKNYNLTPTDADQDLSEVLIAHYHGMSRIYKYGLNKIASDQVKLTGVFANFHALYTFTHERIEGRKAPAKVADKPHTPAPAAAPTPAAVPAVPDRRSLFVIVGAMRTGSNLLQETLNSYEGVVCHGELFNPAFIGETGTRVKFERSLASRDRDVAGFLGAMDRANKNASVGFRLFSGHTELALNWVLEQRNPKFIVLRRSAVDSFISLKIAQQTKQWLLRSETERKSTKIQIIEAQFEEFCASLDSFYIRSINKIRYAGHGYFPISYNELLDSNVMNGAAKFLGSSEERPNITPTLVRQNVSPAQETIENHEEAFVIFDRVLRRYPNLTMLGEASL